MHAPSALLDCQSQLVDILTGPKLPPACGAFRFYRRDFRNKLEANLTDYYPSLPALLGQAVWIDELVNPFIDEQIPPSWNLVEWVKLLPGWLSNRGMERLSPLLIPLAEFERLHMETFFSPYLEKPSQMELATAKFQLQPNVRFLKSPYPLKAYREALLKGIALPPLDGSYNQWLLFSLDDEGDVVVTELMPDEKLFLEAIQGRTLDEALLFFSQSAHGLMGRLASEIGSWTAKWIRFNFVAMLP